MIHHISKKTAIYIIIFCLFFYLPSKAHAGAPDVEGYVVTNTGAPVAGVWVKLLDNYDLLDTDFISKDPNYPHDIYYEQTDSNGHYFFRSWWKLQEGSYYPNPYTIDYFMNRQIDSNLDGINDTPQVIVNKLHTDGTPFHTQAFGCAENHGQISVVQPVTMGGTFTAIFPVALNNTLSVSHVQDIIFTPYPNTVAGSIFIDSNNNGTKDVGETGASGGITVTATGPTGVTATSDSLGNYLIPGLKSGYYTVTVLTPNGFVNTSPKAVGVTIP